MADRTSIEWTDTTWNPVTGCTEVSPGCDHCYAKTFAQRWRGVPGHYFEHGFDVQLRPDKLDAPLRWRRPRRVFVNSMSDLFHTDVPDEFIRSVWNTMALTPQYTYQILTKRPARMRALLTRWCGPLAGPLPNVWLGVSAESQQWADIRIPVLVDTPAAARFLSCEPLLTELDLTAWLGTERMCPGVDMPAGGTACGHDFDCCTSCLLDWVIVGGESGPRARPMHPDWPRSLRDQCSAAGVPFFFKQWGEWAPATGDTGPRRVGKRAAGRVLDGQVWDQFPHDFPHDLVVRGAR